jgi:hypothetical protein
MEGVDDIMDELAGVLAIGNISLEQFTVASHLVNLSAQFFGGTQTGPEVDGNRGAPVSQLHGDRPTDAARRPGDESDLAFELPLDGDSGFWMYSNRSHFSTPFP